MRNSRKQISIRLCAWLTVLSILLLSGCMAGKDYEAPDLTPQMASQMGMNGSGGAVVTDVVPWSSAMQKGITPGMKILEVNHSGIDSARGFREAVSRVKAGDLVTLKLQTPDGVSRIVNLRADVG